jgi:hypothetical protein
LNEVLGRLIRRWEDDGCGDNGFNWNEVNHDCILWWFFAAHGKKIPLSMMRLRML